jgi:hypothetical protein
MFRQRRDAIVTDTADASVDSPPFAYVGNTCAASCQRATLPDQTGDTRRSSECSRESRAPLRRRRRAAAAYHECEAICLACVPRARESQRKYGHADAHEHSLGYCHVRRTVRGE